MQVRIDEILKKVKKAKVNNESRSVLWLVAQISGLDESVVEIEDIDVQRLSREGLLEREKGGIVINLDFDTAEITQEQVDNYRNIWKGLFTGSMGSPEGVKDKMIRWLNSNPKYTYDDICRAAKYWIENKGREVDNINLIGQADYFIYKKEGKSEHSRLSSVIGEALMGSNWTEDNLLI